LRPGDVCEGFVYLGRAERDDQFGVFRREDDPVIRERQREREDDRRRSQRRPAPAIPSSDQPHPGGNGVHPGPDLGELARRLAGNLTPELRHELAEALGLGECCLSALPLLGYDPDDRGGPCWTFPEADAAGRVVGHTTATA
jgi:hypothetical protein